MELEIKVLKEEHVKAAAELFVQGYRKQRLVTPDLPVRYEQVENILRAIGHLLKNGSGIAAFQGDRMVGYLLGVHIKEFKGKHDGVYIPEWGHAVIGEGRVHVYEQMYSAISEYWVDQGYYNQAISLLVHDRDLQDFWFYSGFGMHSIDCIRSLEAIDLSDLKANGTNLRIVKVTKDEIDDLLELGEAHERYYSTGPIFLPFLQWDDQRQYFEEYLAQPDFNIWLAYQDDRPVAYLQGKTANPKSSGLIMDQGTASVGGAYADPAVRGQGVGTLLLARAVDWARENGYHRLSVDFESANIYGRKFWLRHFEPYSHSMLRHVDERMADAVNTRLSTKRRFDQE